MRTRREEQQGLNYVCACSCNRTHSVVFVSPSLSSPSSSDAHSTASTPLIGSASPLRVLAGGGCSSKLPSATSSEDGRLRTLHDPLQLLILTDDVTTPLMEKLLHLAAQYARNTLHHAVSPLPTSDINHRLAALRETTDESFLLTLSSSRPLTRVEHDVFTQLVFPPIDPTAAAASNTYGLRRGRGGGRGGGRAGGGRGGRASSELQGMILLHSDGDGGVGPDSLRRPDRPKSTLKKHVWMHGRISERASKAKSTSGRGDDYDAPSGSPLSDADRRLFDHHFDLVAYLDGPSLGRVKIPETNPTDGSAAGAGAGAGAAGGSSAGMASMMSFFTLNQWCRDDDSPTEGYHEKLFAYGKELRRYASLQQLLCVFTATDTMKRYFACAQSLNVTMDPAVMSVTNERHMRRCQEASDSLFQSSLADAIARTLSLFACWIVSLLAQRHVEQLFEVRRGAIRQRRRGVHEVSRGRIERMSAADGLS